MGMRAVRLADEIRYLLASCFVGDRLRDPRLQGISITHVRLTGDLQQATVFFRTYDSSKLSEVEAGLRSCAGFLRTSLSGQIQIRKLPELRFRYDESIEQGAKIEAMLEQINKDAPPEEPEE